MGISSNCAFLRYVYIIHSFNQAAKMIVLLLLSLCMPFLFGHPASSIDHSEPSCSTLKALGQSVKDSRLHGSLCLDSETKTECTTASLDLMKKCIDGVKVDSECLLEIHNNLADVDDKACFCGGLAKFSQMLTSVEAILCEVQGNDRAGAGRLFFASGNKNWFGNWLGFGPKPKSPSTTTPTPSSTVGAASAAATTLQAKAAALSANKDTVSAVSTKVAAVTGSKKRRRRRAIANNCVEFTTLVIDFSAVVINDPSSPDVLVNGGFILESDNPTYTEEEKASLVETESSLTKAAEAVNAAFEEALTNYTEATGLTLSAADLTVTTDDDDAPADDDAAPAYDDVAPADDDAAPADDDAAPADDDAAPAD